MESFSILREVRKVALTKSEEFAKKIMNIAKMEDLTTPELHKAIYIVNASLGGSAEGDKLAGIEQLTEIYELITAKVIGNLNVETEPSDKTYKMLAIAYDLYNQMNPQTFNYPRF